MPGYKNENSDDGNQKATSECGVSFKQKSLQSCYCAISSSFSIIAIGLRSRFTKIISKLLDYDEFCANEGIPKN